MPGLVHRGMKMKHAWNALRTMLACAAILGALSISALAAPGDQPNPTDKFKNLEFREIGPASMCSSLHAFPVEESTPNIVYVGTASGGVVCSGRSVRVGDGVQDKESVSTIGDIAI